MIGPKRKRSIRKRRIKHGQWQTNTIKKLVKKVNLVKCSNCGGYKYSHRVCLHCGFYGGKQILTIKQKSKENIIES